MTHSDSVTFEVARVDHTIEEPSDGEPFPVIHAFGYDDDHQWCHAEIIGFEPYFYAPYDEIDAVNSATTPEVTRIEEYDMDGDPFTSVRRERLARVVVSLPTQISEVRDAFSQTWESDVFYSQRFLTDLDVQTGLTVPRLDEPVHVNEVETTDVNYDFRIHYMDIEVEDRYGFPEDGTEPILCITAYDSFDDTYITWIQGEGDGDGSDADAVEYADESKLHPSASVEVRRFDNEPLMLLNYCSYLAGSKPSVITGWNIDDFDAPYFFNRCEVLNEQLAKQAPDERPIPEIPLDSISPLRDVSHSDYFGPRVKGVAVYDLLYAFKRMQFTELDSYSLDRVAEAHVGETKETYVGDIGGLWEDDPRKLVDYNLRDVELLVELDRRQEIIAFGKEVKSEAACQLADAPTESTVADRYLLREYHGEVIFPNQNSQEEVSDGFAGGAVFEPIDGILKNVPALDLKSLYPMSMLTINASPETKVDSDEYDGETFVSPNGIHFRKDIDGITKRMIENLLTRREAKKDDRDAHSPETEIYDVLDRQQTAIKVIMNALYGMMGWSRFRLYDQEVASATTATGRDVIGHTAETCVSLGYPVAYGDTDSVLLELDASMDKAETIEVCFEIEETINDSYDTFAKRELNADTHRFQIEFEKLYKTYFQADSKKRYAGHIIWKEGKDVDDVDITGFQYKRSDCSKLGKRVQKQTIELIVYGADTEEVVEYVESEMDAFDRREVELEAIGVPQGIGSPMNEYNADTHTVRAAKLGNLIVGTTFASGSKPKRYYLDDVHPALFARLESEQGFDVQRDRAYAKFKREPWVIAVDRAEELPPELIFDWDRMKAKNLEQNLKGIMNALGVEWNELQTTSQQAGLADFTGA
jgi:DNA polymerase elongation subunit (family B)